MLQTTCTSCGETATLEAAKEDRIPQCQGRRATLAFLGHVIEYTGVFAGKCRLCQQSFDCFTPGAKRDTRELGGGVFEFPHITPCPKCDHGGSLVELSPEDPRWSLVAGDSTENRRKHLCTACGSIRITLTGKHADAT